MHYFKLLFAAYVLLPPGAVAFGQDKASRNPAGYPGQTTEGYLLPNGWRVTPAGQQVLLTDLPLNIRTTPDGKFAIVATNGYNAHELSVVELATGKKVSVENAPQSWFGLAADESTGRLWWSGGGDAVIRSFAVSNGRLEPRETLPIADTSKDAESDSLRTGFRTGVYFDTKSESLYSLTAIPKGGNKSFAWGDPVSDKNAGGAITR